MKRSLKQTLVVLAVMFSPATTATAETRYVTDKLKVNVRSGESAQHRIVTRVHAGDPLQVVAENKQTGYTRVKTASGKNGYILSRFLESEPGAREQLEAATARLKQLEADPDAIQEKYAKLSTEHDKLMIDFDSLSNEKEEIEQELIGIRTTAANAIEVFEEKNRLRKQVSSMATVIEDQKLQIQELSNDQNQYWFMVGGGIAFLGILVGLILPNLKLRRRRGSWDSI